jgi:hypothetical protein
MVKAKLAARLAARSSRTARSATSRQAADVKLRALMMRTRAMPAALGCGRGANLGETMRTSSSTMLYVSAWWQG